jgi:hypothetical protein
VVEPLREVAIEPLLSQLPTDLDTSGIRKWDALFGAWDLSITPRDAAAWFAGFPGTWAIAGGWAIELFVGHPVREHHDMDVSVARHDAGRVHDQLPGWELFFPSPGRFTPFPVGAVLPDEQHQLWCRRSADGPWLTEVLFEDVRGDRLHYRRAPSWSVPLAEGILRTADGIPFIAPHVQLMFKANNLTQRDFVDVAAAAPHMSDAQRAFLADYCRKRNPAHPWLPLLA